jgi:hypothetical protein
VNIWKVNGENLVLLGGTLGLFQLGVVLVLYLFWVVSGFVFGLLCILFVYSKACLCFPCFGLYRVLFLGFLCMLEALCVVLVYLEALGVFF